MPMNLVGIIGEDCDADHIPIKEQMPDGFAAFMGSAWSGEYEWFPIVDCQLSLERKAFKFVMSLGQAQDMVEALRGAINTAMEATKEAISEKIADEADHGDRHIVPFKPAEKE